MNELHLLHFRTLSCSVHPNDAAPLAVSLRSLTTSLFLFLFLHHAHASVLLNLASSRMGDRPGKAATRLKIEFQVENIALPSFLPLHGGATDSSLIHEYL